MPAVSSLKCPRMLAHRYVVYLYDICSRGRELQRWRRNSYPNELRAVTAVAQVSLWNPHARRVVLEVPAYVGSQVCCALVRYMLERARIATVATEQLPQ